MMKRAVFGLLIVVAMGTAVAVVLAAQYNP